MLPPPSSPSISQGPLPSPAGPPAGPLPPDTGADDINKLNLDPNLLSKAKGPHQCNPGDTYTLTLTVTANSDGGFDVVDAQPLQIADKATSAPGSNDDGTVEPGSDDEEKLLGYKRPAKKNPILI
jgi:hypothetical protein